MRLSRRARVVVVALVPAALATALTAGAATGLVHFPGGDAALQDAARTGHGSPLAGSATAGGVTVAISSILADTTETVLAVEIAGKEELGGMASPAGRPMLTDASGATYLATHLMPDQSKPRMQSWVFPPLAPHATGLVLSFEGVQIWNRPADPQSPGASAAAAVTTLQASFKVPLKWSGTPEAAVHHDAVPANAPFGPGYLVVDSFTVGPTGSVVSGHVDGISPDDIPEILMWPSTLVLPGGRTVTAFAGGSGFGDGRAQFEFRFQAVELDGATLSVAFGVSDHPGDVGRAAALQQFKGSFATVLLRASN